MKKLNSAIITLAAVMSMSASAMAAPLCTNTLSPSVLACTAGSTNCTNNLNASVLASTSGSTNCNINSILENSCSGATKGTLQYFTNLGFKYGNTKTTGNSCNLTKTTTNNTTTAPTTTAPTTTAPTTTAPTTTAPTTTAPTTTAPTTTAPTTTAPTTTAPTTTAPTTDTTATDTTVTDTTTTSTNSNTSASSYAQEVVNLVNAERAKEGLSPLSVDTKVAAAAQVRAAEIKTSFSHTRPDGRSCFTALAEAGASYSGAGENIAIGQKTPSEVVTAWMNSEGHRKNIMNANFKYIGIGVNGTAWAQLFTY